MLEIISAKSFTTTFWKNGKGQTTELAISEGGNLDNFDWRLSIATVAEDGPFSNFKGYDRNLVLIEGNGLTLTHDVIHTDRLAQILDFATFDGGSHTQGEIINGTIKDFNIMTARSRCSAKVNTYKSETSISITTSDLTFIYSLSNDTEITLNDGTKHKAAKGDLAKITAPEKYVVSGTDLIVINISYLNSN